MKVNIEKKFEEWWKRRSKRTREISGFIFIAIAGAMAAGAFGPVGYLSFIIIIAISLTALYLAHLTVKSERVNAPAINI